MHNVIFYSFIQLVAGFCAFIALGQTCADNATMLDKVIGYIACFMFIVLILFIQGVLK